MSASKNAAIQCEEDTDSVLLAAVKPKAASTDRVTGGEGMSSAQPELGWSCLCPQPSSPFLCPATCIQDLSCSSLLTDSESPCLCLGGSGTGAEVLLAWFVDLVKHVPEELLSMYRSLGTNPNQLDDQ